LRTGVGFAQTTYRWRPQSVPALNRLAILSGDTARTLVPGNAAVPAPAAAAASQPAAAVRGPALILYNTMRDALRRGDWGAFGRAFDSLGHVLGGAKTP
jgi:uncharacterized membrane protein (UPF0182 family)